jgi:hypothetical protein
MCAKAVATCWSANTRRSSSALGNPPARELDAGGRRRARRCGRVVARGHERPQFRAVLGGAPEEQPGERLGIRAACRRIDAAMTASEQRDREPSEARLHSGRKVNREDSFAVRRR